MKDYVLSFAIGVAVGLLYAALRVKSPAPPLVARVGRLGMVWGEEGYQCIVKIDTSFLDAIGCPGVLVEEIADGAIVDASPTAWEHGSWFAIVQLHFRHHAYRCASEMPHLWRVVWDRSFARRGAPECRAWERHRRRGRTHRLTDDSPVGEVKIGSLRFIQRVVLDFDLPTGEYQRAAKLGLTCHAFDVQPYDVVTFFPTRHLESSWRMHYLWNGTNRAPGLASGVQSTHAGEAVHFNAALGYGLSHEVWIGVNGYYLTHTDPRSTVGRGSVHRNRLVRSVQERYGVRGTCSCTPCVSLAWRSQPAGRKQARPAAAMASQSQGKHQGRSVISTEGQNYE